LTWLIRLFDHKSKTMKHLILAGFILVIIGSACQDSSNYKIENQKDPVTFSEKYQPLESTQKPVGSHSELGLAGYAKVLCSAVFVSGRQPEEAFQNSGYFFMPNGDNSGIKYQVDHETKTVTLTLADSLVKSAKYYGAQGCIIQTSEGLQFEPVEVSSSLPDASTLAWPMGDSMEASIFKSLNSDSIKAVIDLAFAEEALTAAFLVVYKGEIIAEKYREGITKDTQLESWSMGKSLTATLVGRLVQENYFKLDDFAPVAAWKQEGDPRGEIRIRDLLQMSSGLRFISHRDPEVATYKQYLDHMYIYTGAINAFEYSINRPLQFSVGSECRYRNCDPLTLGYILRRQLESKSINYHLFPQKELFDKIGIRKQVMETDPYGNFLLTGYDYGTARNWARLGILYLNDGVVNGERLLPKGWSTFVSTPAPAWKEPVYGGLFWLNQTGEYPIPKDAYYMGGGGGQRTIIIPSMNMVVVRLGHFRGGQHSDKALKKALAKLMKQIKGQS